jgi:hypothetical protein
MEYNIYQFNRIKNSALTVRKREELWRERRESEEGSFAIGNIYAENVQFSSHLRLRKKKKKLKKIPLIVTFSH